MTTIAFDGKTIASDSQSSMDGIVVSRQEQKVFTGEDWTVNGRHVIAAGMSGDCGVEEEVFNVMSVGLDFMSDFSPQIEFYALLVVGENESYFVMKPRESTRASVMLQRGMFAIGSGDVIAITAMHLGKTAAEAVQIAIELDTRSGGDVVTVGI